MPELRLYRLPDQRHLSRPLTLRPEAVEFVMPAGCRGFQVEAESSSNTMHLLGLQASSRSCTPADTGVDGNQDPIAGLGESHSARHLLQAQSSACRSSHLPLERVSGEL